MQRILGGERAPARQLELAAVDGASARAPYLDAPSTHHQLSGGRARAVRSPRRQMRVPRSGQLRALVFQHGRQRGGAGADHELVQIGADHVGERELRRRRRRYYFLELPVPGSVLHGGLSGLSTPRILSGPV